MSEQDIVVEGQPAAAPDAASEGALREPAAPVAPRLLAPLLAALVCVVLTVLTWSLLVATTRGQQVEEAARIGSAATRESLYEVTGFLLGVVSVPFLIAVVVAAVLVALVQRRWSIAIAAIVVLCGSNLTTQVLQELLERPVDDASAIPLNSFPSGHATVASSIAATALLVAPVRWRPVVGLIGAVLTAALGVSTMIGNEVGAWHRGSDVVAAILITAAWYFLVEAVLAVSARRPVDVAERAAVRRRVWIPLRILTAIGALCAGLGVGCLLATAVRAPITSDLGYQVAFVGSVLGVTAVAFFAVAAMLRLRTHHPHPTPAP